MSQQLQDVYLVWAKRTPMGKIGGALSSVRVDDLMSIPLAAFKTQATFDLKEIDDVLVGCANQAGEDNRNLGRMALLLAGLPLEVPGTTLNRLCGSGLDAIMHAYARIASGMADCILAGGAESMSRGPYVISKAQSPYDREQKMWDSSFGWRFPNARMKEMFPLLGMGETAEEIAKKYPQITRQLQDQFALDSHRKASAAYDKNLFEREITPITITEKKSTSIVNKDECVRSDSSLEALAKLKPAFTKDGSVTAGNSSPMNDGAAAVCLVSGDFLKRHKLAPLLKITGGVARGIHPNVMGLGPVAAVNSLCQRHKINVGDFDVVELNEAFAVQALACIQDLKIDSIKVNKRGGAIALGHPLGCSGARLMTTLTSIMQDDAKLKRGLLAMCIGVGQGIAVSVENCR